MTTAISISITPINTRLYLGDTQQYISIATYDDGSIVDVSSIATWSVSDSLLGEINSSGLFTSKGLGTIIISVEYSNGGSPVTTVQTATTLLIHSPLIIPIVSDETSLYRPTTENYLALITSQYQNSPKFLEWVFGFVDMAVDIQKLATSLVFYFSFDKIIKLNIATEELNSLTTEAGAILTTEMMAAIGDQLDMIGVILGQKRTVNFQPTGGISPILDDDTYRILLRAKVLMNHWDGKSASLQIAWANLFPGGKISIQDNQNMTVSVLLTGTFSSIINDLIINEYIIPRPQGVLFNYYYGTTPFFGFDRQDEYIAGFDTGNWV